MKKLVGIAAIFAVIAAGAAFVVWQQSSKPAPEPVLLAPYDYALDASWAAKPATPPPAVWEDGWAIDVVLLESQARRDTEELSEALSEIGPVYAPHIRAAHAGEDYSDGLQAYLEAHNNGRAFVIATNLTMPASAAAVINSDPMVRARFGGILMLPGLEAPFGEGVNASSVCSDRFGAGEVCATPVEVRRADGVWTIAGDGPAGGVVVDGFMGWLNTTAPKMAEPLGPLEEVEIIDIRRPGQTDD